MDLAARLMMVAGLLLAAAVLSSRLSIRAGIPLILLFILIGFVAGPEGPFRVPQLDPVLASGVALTFMALILFDGGLTTPVEDIRRVAGPATALATVGVLVTAGVVAATAVYLLDFSWTQGMLLGSIVGSTDAAAVFAVQRGRGVLLPSRLRKTLEVETGLNDPIAVFLAIAFIGMLQQNGNHPSWWGVGFVFLRQIGVGMLVGLLVGWGTARAMRLVHLDVAGLYLALTTGAALLAFGAAHVLGGSAFASVFVAGVVVGSARVPMDRGIRRFHDGTSWIAQVSVFVLVGAIATPSHLVRSIGPGLIIAGVLVFLARPLAVLVSATPFRFNWREQVVLSFGGFRGAFPVIVATLPLAAGVPQAETMFHLVFFVVLLSVLVQGTLFVPLARRLGLTQPAVSEPPVSLELTALRETGQELLGYRVEAGSPAEGRPVRELPLPRDALVLLLVRGVEVIAPRGSTVLQARDQVYVLYEVSQGPLVGRLFRTSRPDTASLAGRREFSFDAQLATVGDLQEFYGVSLDRSADVPLASWLLDHLPRQVEPGQRLRVQGLDLLVLSVRDGQPHMVALDLGTGMMPAAPPPPVPPAPAPER